MRTGWQSLIKFKGLEVIPCLWHLYRCRLSCESRAGHADRSNGYPGSLRSCFTDGRGLVHQFTGANHHGPPQGPRKACV